MKCVMCGSIVLLAVMMTRANDLSYAQFLSPEKDLYPETWFHFIGGNVADAGLNADLEAISGAGISGIQFFHGQFGGPWPGVSPQIKCLSEPWDGLVSRVADTCRRLGLRFTMQNCPGWAMSGGPWIEPQDAMRKLITSRITIQAGATQETFLPIPHAGRDDYQDIAVLAFPQPTGEVDGFLNPVSVTSNLKSFEWAKTWRQGKAIPLGAVKAGEETWFEFSFAKPVTVRTVEIPCINTMSHPWCYVPDTTVTVFAGEKVISRMELPSANWQDDHPVSMACDEVTAARFRVSVRNGHGINLLPIRLSAAARKENWEAEAGWTLRSLIARPTPLQSRSAWVDPVSVTNVTHLFDADGNLHWAPPSGTWTVLRLGHVNLGRRNGPAPKEATGWECDKLAKKGAEKHFAGYIGRLAQRGGAVHGKMQGVLLDSWECARQTWTEGMQDEFSRRNGYPIWSWMPALFGYVLDTPETTAKFLRDWRQTVSDMICENFFARMAELCHDEGLKLSFETAFGDVIPGDIMQYYQYADTPMCEFWQPLQENFVGSDNFKPILPCASAAHLYGKRRVAAEAFTSFALTWDEKLRDLKHVANLHFADGLTHLVFHTYTHNPRTDWLPPGTSFGASIGTPFLRGQTWWKMMPQFTAYIARCGAMLEAGRPVFDVLWYLGDELDHKPAQDAPFPEGYRYDYCNPDAFLRRVAVKDGCWQTPEGLSYRVLWFPKSSRMAPETLQRLIDGVRAGGVANLSGLPTDLVTLRGGEEAQQRFRLLREILWGEPDPEFKTARRLGKGRIFFAESLARTLQKMEIAPDVVAKNLRWIHRTDGTRDWYFVTGSEKNGFCGEVSFRAKGAVEIWRPETGKAQLDAPVMRRKERTIVSLDLAPSEACFVVFDRTKKPAAEWVSLEQDGHAVSLISGSPNCRMEVLSAKYGAKDKWMDVATVLQKQLDRGEVSVTPFNEWAGGDPIWGTPKQLEAKVRLFDGSVAEISLKEGSRYTFNTQIPPPELPPCTISGTDVIAWTNGNYRLTRADGSQCERNVHRAFCLPLKGTWNVSFPEGWDAPSHLRMRELVPWKEMNGTVEGRSFSGTATYGIDFSLQALDTGSRILLDLGRVESLATVFVNGHRFRPLWSYPYRVDITSAVKTGVNRLSVEVTDTWHNRLVFDAGQSEAKRKTWTISGPRAENALVSSGLLGPVYLYRGELIR